MPREALAQVEDQTAPQKRVVQALNQTRIKEAAFMRNEWFVSVPAGTMADDLSDSAYWRNVAQMFKPFDMIEAVTEDGAWYARFIIIKADRLWAKVHRLEFANLLVAHENMPLTEDQNHAVEWKGPTSKFAVIRKSDMAVLKDGFQSQLEGMQWLDGHLKSLRA